MLQKAWGAMGEGESDEFKRVLLEGNPIFLALTCAVSLLHSVFDFFAFKNDIGFWKNKKSVEGLSVRTIAINCFCQVLSNQHVKRQQSLHPVAYGLLPCLCQVAACNLLGPLACSQPNSCWCVDSLKFIVTHP